MTHGIYIVCASRTVQKPNCGWLRPCTHLLVVSPPATYNLWVADPRQVTFLCPSKEKSPKEIRPGRFAAQTSHGTLRASLRPGARLTRRAHTTRLGLEHESREYSRPGSVLGSLRRGLELPTSGLYAEVFSTPRMARPSIASLCPPARRGAGGMPVRRARHRDVPLRDLHGKGAKRRTSAPFGRAFFSSLFFARAKKRDPPAVRKPQIIRRRRRHK